MIPVVVPTATPSGGGGIIVFDWIRERNQDIYAIDLSAQGDPIRLTDNPDVDRAPAWSPDGSYIAFTSRREANWDLYLLHVATGETSRLTHNTHYDGAPAWSPDGQFLAFESTREGDLDVFVLRLSDGTIKPVTTNPAADFEPAWSPDGRYIAFLSWRDGNQEIYLASSDGQSAPINVTNDPAADYSPQWLTSDVLSFMSQRAGRTGLYIQTLEEAGIPGEPQMVQAIVGTGNVMLTDHAWSPDGKRPAYVYQRWRGYQIVLPGLGGHESAVTALASRDPIGKLDWHAGPVTLTAKPGVEPAPLLYTEFVGRDAPPYDLKDLPGVDAPSARLSDRVDDSFNALRQRVRDETGYDFLAVLSDAWRPMGSPRKGGASYRSWHKAGRAFDTRTEFRAPSGRDLLVVAREDNVGLWRRTYWRLYLRTVRQDGSMGEPMKQPIWDFFARFVDDDAAKEGGRQLPMPAGYYVDFTKLAAEYGWERIPAIDRYGLSWKDEWAASEYWHFERRDGLIWRSAMLEIYDEGTYNAQFGYPRQR